jgi:polyphosphate kinase
VGGEETDVFWALRNGDVLLHHPYDSFANSVEKFVDQAARDPMVLAIKQTLYRTSGDEAGIVASLAKAAEEGKEVVALVELKARFDEQANIERARMLEQAGAHVVYGLVGLKTHAKILLVVRQETDGIRRYCHVGTGNYNPKTATSYEDLGVLSCDPDLGFDLSELFNHLTGYSRPGEYRRLLVAPMHLRDELRSRIRSQAHPDGRIVMKMNALVDSELVDELYAASLAGARTDLIVRSICCLRAGVPGLSENITVRSIVGRYLEHSRLFRFGEPGVPETEYVIGSADLMPRNLDRRVEAMLCVNDPRMRTRLDEILETELADDVLAWNLGPDGTWRKVETRDGIEAQVRFQELALARGKRATDT